MERINRRGRGSSGAEGRLFCLQTPPHDKNGWEDIHGGVLRSGNVRSRRQARSPLEGIVKSIVQMRGHKKALVRGEIRFGAARVGRVRKCAVEGT